MNKSFEESASPSENRPSLVKETGYSLPLSPLRRATIGNLSLSASKHTILALNPSLVHRGAPAFAFSKSNGFIIGSEH